jgi:DNA polymerase (family 10)
MIKRARDKGCMFSINSDSHDLNTISYLKLFGIGIARRAWLTPKDVINTEKIKGLKDAFKR